MASPTVKPVLRTDYQRSVADYWNKEKDPVNLRLGEVDGLYHHHYGLGAYDPAVLEAPAEVATRRSSPRCTGWRPRRPRCCSTTSARSPPGGRLLDAGCGRGGTQHHGQRRASAARSTGCRISEQQVEFANDQAAERGVADQVRYHFRNMLDTGFETGSFNGIWTNETHDVRGPASSCSPSTRG